MEETVAVRTAAVDAVADVEPESLRTRIEDRLENGSMAPGVLTVLSARAVHKTASSSGDTRPFPTDAVLERAAGVQLIYEGLRLTRALSHDEPWVHGDPEPADMAILVADVLVARGFYLLARTDAAGEAVATVRAFGHDQTVRHETGDQSLDRNLEADVFELAVAAGATAIGTTASDRLRDYVGDLARTNGTLPTSDGIFSESTVETLSSMVGGDRSGASGGVRSSADY